MKTKIKAKMLLAATAATMLMAACSDATDVLEPQQNSAAATTDGSIAFDAYLSRSTTRAGYTSVMNTTALREAEGGFGVFAYYGDGVLYNQTIQPNFMYNQKVEWNAPVWEYSPVKYWPNEFGSDAKSTDVDRLSFFAYAPYVDVSPATGTLTSDYDDSEAAKSTTTGITRLSRATDTGDPYVHYAVSFKPSEGVDLCWGVASTDFTEAVGSSEGKNDVKAGMPYIDLAKSTVTGRINFDFRHALAALNVQIDANVDAVDQDNSQQVGSGTINDASGKKFTRIWVRSVTFDGFATEGALNLNNPAKRTPYWRSDSRSSYLSTSAVTINDGRRDGREGASANNYEIPTGLNPMIVQGSEYDASHLTSGLNTQNESDNSSSEPGVMKEAVNLFDVESMYTGSYEDLTPEQLSTLRSAPLFVIPNGAPLRVTIAYDVETYDPKMTATYLADGVTNGTSIENIISTTVRLDGNNLELEAGKRYALKLHLGMNSVKTDVSVVGWDDEPNVDVELPENGMPLTLEAIQNGSIEIKYPTSAVTGLNNPIYYVKNGIKYEGTASVVGGTETIDVKAGDIVQLFGKNETYYETKITNTQDCYIYGNLMSLIFDDEFATETKLTRSYTLHQLFMDNTKIKNHPDYDIALSATTLQDNCYGGLFWGCKGLTRAPELPATTLANSCYSAMFTGCTNLIKAPSVLPAMVLTDACYCYMFQGCYSLTSAPELPATTIARYCYRSMFEGCYDLVNAPEVLPATTLYDFCYNDMFKFCTKLTTAPELPATTLANSCYSSMFYHCDELTKAPILPAETLVSMCYNQMFTYCTKLNKVICLATNGFNAYNCIGNWLMSAGYDYSPVLYKNPATPAYTAAEASAAGAAAGTYWTKGDYSKVPTQWTIKNYGE